MNLGYIKQRARSLKGSTTATRWNDLLLQQYANDAQVQLSLDIDYPQATQVFQTNPPPGVPTLTLVTGPTPNPMSVIAAAGQILNVAADGSAVTTFTTPTLNPALVGVQAINLTISNATLSSPPFSSLSVKWGNGVLNANNTVTFEVVVTGGDTGETCTVNYEVVGQ